MFQNCFNLYTDNAQNDFHQSSPTRLHNLKFQKDSGRRYSNGDNGRYEKSQTAIP